MDMIIKALFIAEVCEKNTCRELEITLGPKLGFPCSFHVATDNIVAFELTRLQDFHVIIVAQNKSRHDYFDTSNLINILKALDGCCPPMIFLTDDETQLASQQSNCSTEFFYVRCCAGNEFVLDELCAAINSAVQKTHSSTQPSQVSTPPSAVTTLQRDFVVAAPVNLQSSFTMELEATHFESDHQLSPTPMSVPVVEEDGMSFSFEINEFDTFLADLCDDSDDGNNSFLAEDHRGNKRSFSFDSDGTVEDVSSLTSKKAKPESMHMEQYHHGQCTTILDPEDFEQLLQMFPDFN